MYRNILCGNHQSVLLPKGVVKVAVDGGAWIILVYSFITSTTIKLQWWHHTHDLVNRHCLLYFDITRPSHTNLAQNESNENTIYVLHTISVTERWQSR